MDFQYGKVKKISFIIFILGMGLLLFSALVASRTCPGPLRSSPLPFAIALTVTLLLAAFILLWIEAHDHARREIYLEHLAENHRDWADVLQSILTNMNHGVMVADENGKALNWNPAAERLGATDVPFELPAEGAEIESAAPGSRHSPFHLHLARAVKGHSLSGAEHFVRTEHHPSGVWVGAHAMPLQDRAGRHRGGAVVMSDITDLKRAQEEIQRLREELERRDAESESGFHQRKAA